MKLNRIILGLLLLGATLLFCVGCAAPVSNPALTPTTPASPLPSAPLTEELRAVFFDVGQADSILISCGDSHMLIDAGNLGQDELLTSYLAAYGISQLDYLVATHPHADHIGSMAAVIYALDNIDQVLMPEAIATTAVFERLLDAIEQRGLEITVPEPGAILPLGAATIEVLAPQNREYENMNDYSIVLRVSYGQVSLLLTGDGEALSEAEQLQAHSNLTADILKVGHHGSASSTTEPYLDAVSPSYAIISCGKDNSYGHPHREVLARLQERQVEVYRTDELGSIEIVTDGESIAISSAQATPGPQENSSYDEGYIGNRNSQVFHMASCESLPAEHNRVFFSSREDALAENYRPCGNCRP